jgi:hypothetical protein
MLQFASYYYIFSPNIACSINSAPIACVPIDNQSLYLPYSNPTTNKLLITVTNIYNYIKPSNWTLKSVQTHVNNGLTSYSDVDLYYNDGTNLKGLQASKMNIRVILPFNYVQSTPVTFSAIIDSQYSSFLPLNSFNLNFTTQDGSCKLLSSSYMSTLSVTCTFTSSVNY